MTDQTAQNKAHTDTSNPASSPAPKTTSTFSQKSTNGDTPQPEATSRPKAAPQKKAAAKKLAAPKTEEKAETKKKADKQAKQEELSPAQVRSDNIMRAVTGQRVEEQPATITDPKLVSVDRSGNTRVKITKNMTYLSGRFHAAGAIVTATLEDAQACEASGCGIIGKLKPVDGGE